MWAIYENLAIILTNKANYTLRLIYAKIKYTFCVIKPLYVMYTWSITLVTGHFCDVSTSKTEDIIDITVWISKAIAMYVMYH